MAASQPSLLRLGSEVTAGDGVAEPHDTAGCIELHEPSGKERAGRPKVLPHVSHWTLQHMRGRETTMLYQICST